MFASRPQLWSIFCLLAVLAIEGTLSALTSYQLADPTSKFSFSPPVNEEGFELISLESSRGSQSFFFDEGKAFSITSPFNPDIMLSAFAFSYKPGNGRMWHDIFGHSPDICLPSSGAKEIAPPKKLDLEGLPKNAQITQFVFSHPVSPAPIHVYKCVWIDRDDWTNNLSTQTSSHLARMRTAFESKRNPEAAFVMTAVFGHMHSKHALDLFLNKVLNHCVLSGHPLLQN